MGHWLFLELGLWWQSSWMVLSQPRGLSGHIFPSQFWPLIFSVHSQLSRIPPWDLNCRTCLFHSAVRWWWSLIHANSTNLHPYLLWCLPWRHSPRSPAMLGVHLSAPTPDVLLEEQQQSTLVCQYFDVCHYFNVITFICNNFKPWLWCVFILICVVTLIYAIR